MHAPTAPTPVCPALRGTATPQQNTSSCSISQPTDASRNYPTIPGLPWHTSWVDGGNVGGMSAPSDPAAFRALSQLGVGLIVTLTETPVTPRFRPPPPQRAGSAASSVTDLIDGYAAPAVVDADYAFATECPHERTCTSCLHVEAAVQEDIFDGLTLHDDLSVLFLPVADGAVPSFDQIDVFLRHVHSFVARGKRVMVHCQAGVGRTGIYLCIYLMDKYGLLPHDATHALRAVRPQSLQFDTSDWISDPFRPRNPACFTRTYLQERFILRYWRDVVCFNNPDLAVRKDEVTIAFNKAFPPPTDCAADLERQLRAFAAAQHEARRVPDNRRGSTASATSFSSGVSLRRGSYASSAVPVGDDIDESDDEDYDSDIDTAAASSVTSVDSEVSGNVFGRAATKSVTFVHKSYLVFDDNNHVVTHQPTIDYINEIMENDLSRRLAAYERTQEDNLNVFISRILRNSICANGPAGSLVASFAQQHDAQVAHNISETSSTRMSMQATDNRKFTITGLEQIDEVDEYENSFTSNVSSRSRSRRGSSSSNQSYDRNSTRSRNSCRSSGRSSHKHDDDNNSVCQEVPQMFVDSTHAETPYVATHTKNTDFISRKPDDEESVCIPDSANSSMLSDTSSVLDQPSNVSSGSLWCCPSCAGVIAVGPARIVPGCSWPPPSAPIDTYYSRAARRASACISVTSVDTAFSSATKIVEQYLTHPSEIRELQQKILQSESEDSLAEQDGVLPSVEVKSPLSMLDEDEKIDTAECSPVKKITDMIKPTVEIDEGELSSDSDISSDPSEDDTERRRIARRQMLRKQRQSRRQASALAENAAKMGLSENTHTDEPRKNSATNSIGASQLATIQVRSGHGMVEIAASAGAETRRRSLEFKRGSKSDLSLLQVQSSDSSFSESTTPNSPLSPFLFNK